MEDARRKREDVKWKTLKGQKIRNRTSEIRNQKTPINTHNTYGVLRATGSILPLKKRWPVRAKSAMYLPISKAITGDS